MTVSNFHNRREIGCVLLLMALVVGITSAMTQRSALLFLILLVLGVLLEYPYKRKRQQKYASVIRFPQHEGWHNGEYYPVITGGVEDSEEDSRINVSYGTPPRYWSE